MSQPHAFAGLTELRAELDAGRVSSAQLVGRALERGEELQPRLRSFIGLRGEAARAEAELADARLSRGELRSALDGIPVAIKDNMVQRGEPTTCGSRILEGFVSPYSSTLV